ncbi:long-chain fatty acid--CoA ligase [Brevibacillus borstelensis]|uniref:class I adenylate-forming enzyme family protein n=1 Tax=Brevibacillus borstelensis TaxID=45462 RepID=UPI000F08A51E|nr:class I adenylate-forming enzyme family protein [Brevibacillus borstelensis]MED1745574.1 class I adenylate-forming enzyme family protein [Brevibacillus borstelensis]MED1881355.1 class I adenylate-forming enzyme family protein [Brevibacillus borstelensis]RNB66726.1 long-chain fatty acid--CoA ligase [Brevibacillus borstelensis]GED52369.1 long-chain-fatty-acid--CoA ligase [Brevibacillus borstelensis]
MAHIIKSDETSCSKERFLGDVQSCVAQLRGSHITDEDRVIVTAENSYEFLVAFFALVEIGCSIALVDCMADAREINEIALDSESRICISDRPLLLSDPIRTFLLSEIVRDGGGNPASELSFSTWSTREDALILYTSGSTGKPKGIVKSGHSFLSNLEESMEVMKYKSEDVLLPLIPFTHFYGLSIVFIWWFAGCDLILCNYKNIRTVLKAVTERGVTVVDGIPSTYYMLTQMCKKREKLCAKVRDSAVRMWCVGGAPLSEELAVSFYDLIKQPLLDGYGLSEVGNVALNTGDYRDGCGKPLPSVKIKVVDNRGNELPSGETGEIYVNSPGVMKEYLHLSEKTEEVLADGWFKTNDLGYLDERGNLHVLGRKGNEIVRKGYVIYPAHIETRLENELKLRARVVSLQDEKKGAYLILFVETRQPFTQQIENAINEALGSILKPDKIMFLPAFPYRPNGKVDFVALQNQAIQWKNAREEEGKCMVQQ